MADGEATLRRRKALRRGSAAEYIAAIFLMLKGYRILAMRYKTKLGEIDIIARKEIWPSLSRSRRALTKWARWMPCPTPRKNASGLRAISGSPASGTMPGSHSVMISLRYCRANCLVISRMLSRGSLNSTGT